MYVWTVWQVCVIVENDSHIVENKWTEDMRDFYLISKYPKMT